ncbi:MAG: NUMOD3 domain-containing DNA-binding protein [Nitrososphaera sp.]
MTIGVYWFYQSSQDRPIYIGSSVDIESRISKHIRELDRGIHKNQRMQRCWSKYGRADFVVDILEITDLKSQLEREQFWMDAISPICNVSVSAWHPTVGRKRPPRSEEWKKNISNALRGRKLSEEHKRKVGDFFRGRKLGPASDEHRRRNSEAHRGKKYSEETRRKVAEASRRKHSEASKQKVRQALLGKKHTEERKTKMRNSLTGRHLTEEHKANIGKAIKGKKFSDEHRRNLSDALKAYHKNKRNQVKG